MIQVEKISTPNFTSQQSSKVIHSHHQEDISVSYKSTYTLKYVLEGHKHYSFGEGDLKVTKDQYLLVNNDRTISTAAKKGTRGLSFFIEKDLIENAYSSISGEAMRTSEFFEYPQHQPDGPLSNWLKSKAHLFLNEKNISPLLIESLFVDLAGLIVQEHTEIRHRLERFGIIKHSTKQELFKLIAQAKEYMHDHMNTSISLEGLSKSIGISKFYLNRLFKELTNTTPVAYITNLRLTEAKSLLRGSKLSLIEISTRCGFESQSYFSRTFKSAFGMTPSAYRALF